MRRTVLLLLLPFCLGQASDPGHLSEHHADRAGGAPSPLPALLDTTDANDLLIVHSEATIRIPYTKIRSLSYCKAADPADPLDSAKPLKGNFRRLLTIGYEELPGASHNLVVQIPSDEERSLLDLEEQTGFKIGSEPRPSAEWHGVTKAAFAPARANEIPEGTRIHCRLDQTISTGSAVGQPVQLSVTEDIEINGAVLVPKGSPVSGMAFQIRGQLDLAIDRVRTADGEDIPLRYFQANGPTDTGAVKAGATVVFWPAAPFILLRQGGDVKIPRGVVFEVFTARGHAIGPS